MKKLKALGASVTLMFVLAVAAFAGETNTPPCAPSDPGETHGPPCAAAQMTIFDSATPGQTQTPPASTEAAEVTVEVAIDLLQSVLLLF